MYTQMCSSVQNMIHGTFITQFGKILAELNQTLYSQNHRNMQLINFFSKLKRRMLTILVIFYNRMYLFCHKRQRELPADGNKRNNETKLL